jgi:hypothetical protein
VLKIFVVSPGTEGWTDENKNQLVAIFQPIDVIFICWIRIPTLYNFVITCDYKFYVLHYVFDEIRRHR